MDGSEKELTTEDMAEGAKRARSTREKDTQGTKDALDADQEDVESATKRPQGETSEPNVTASQQPRTTASAREVDEGELPESLIEPGLTNEYRHRWEAIQVDFVDRPRESVKSADTLVAEVIQKMAQVFADERKQLEYQWSRGEDVSTESLRVALQRYRAFFQRLLSA